MRRINLLFFFFFFFLSLYAFPPKGALGYEAVNLLVLIHMDRFMLSCV